MTTVSKIEKHTKLADFEIKNMIKLYKSGHTIRDVAVATGRSYGSVHRALKNNKIPLRSRGGSKSTKE